MDKQFSLVLGGGAARGLAHIGIIERLDELWMKPVEISGTSIGAIIGVFYAVWYSGVAMRKIALETNFLKFVDLDLRNWLLKWNKIMKYLSKYLGEMSFSDLRIPLSIVATNIDTGEKIIFREGRVIDAIRASIGIPWLFIPYRYNGMHLVDGGIVENLPIQVIQNNHPIIAVSVQIDISKRVKVKKSFLFPNGTMLSNSYGIIRKMIGIMMIQNELRSIQSREDILLIKPGRDDIDYYDFKKMNIMINEGYRAAKDLIK
jgi:NTE family protein